MKAIVDLFSTDYGLMSLGVIAFVVVMGVWFHRFFKKRSKSRRARPANPDAAPRRAGSATIRP